MNRGQLKSEIEDQQADAQDLIENSVLVSRTQLSLFKEYLQASIIKVIMGVRRSGKSTLALQGMIDQKFIYFNFDDEILASVQVKDLGLILEIGMEIVPDAKYLIFDEIQNIDGWELFINKLHRKKKNIILTGSNSRLLSSELTTHLTGRVLTLELLPFSFLEYLGHNLEDRQLKIEEKAQYKNKLFEYIETGGFPDLKQLPKGSRIARQYLLELYERIISRDLIQRRKIRNIKALKELALHLISLYANRFTYQSLKRISSLNSVNTVKNYVDFIQESYIGFVIEPFSNKIKERISLPKKFYIIDTALIDAILSSTRNDYGKKLENIIFLELRRRSCEIYYLYQDGFEVDFAIRKGKKLTELIQVTWDLSDLDTRKRELNALVKAAKEFRVDALTVIVHENHEEEIVIGSHRINIIPAWKWLLNSSLMAL
jgi:predicted AAA+ superfamily ATPase